MVQSIPWIPLFLLTGGILLGLAWAMWDRRDEPGALLFSLLMLASSGSDVTFAELSDGDVLTTGDGEADRTFEVATQPVTSRLGSDRGTIVLLYDVTDRLALERQLHEANDQLSVLNWVLRHDVWNHLSVIAGHPDMLDRRLDDPRGESLEAQRNSVTAIERAASHIEELTRVARDLSESLARTRPRNTDR
jgi:nitrogen-specific signal transduction histidine kinase